jgi:integrase
MTDAELIDAFTAYQATRGYAATTRKRRRSTLRKLAGQMAPVSMLTASWEDVDDMLNDVTVASSRHAYRSDLSAFFEWARKRHLVERNPIEDVDRIKVPKSLPKPAPRAAIENALATAPGDVQLAILLGALAGLRVGEIAALDASACHLDVKPPVVHVQNGKGGKDRIVPLHPLLVARLRRRTGWLFPARTATGHATAKALGARISNALSFGEVRVTSHQLRHYFGTEAARASNGNVILVGSLMGHASPTTTMGYIGWNPREGAEVVNAIAEAVGLTEDELTIRRRLRGAG